MLSPKSSCEDSNLEPPRSKRAMQPLTPQPETRSAIRTFVRQGYSGDPIEWSSGESNPGVLQGSYAFYVRRPFGLLPLPLVVNLRGVFDHIPD